MLTDLFGDDGKSLAKNVYDTSSLEPPSPGHLTLCLEEGRFERERERECVYFLLPKEVQV